MPDDVLRASRVAAAVLSGEGVLTHVRTAAYFTAFLGCLIEIIARFPWRRAWRQAPALLLALPYSLGALLVTWRLILLFFVEHQERYSSHPDPPNLFVEAYALVADAPAGWWWSQLLLGWVLVACPLAAREGLSGSRRKT